ncbi:MAG TPA: hypothetical protein VI653_20360 [Steroidobacteraceae bacterium]
MRHILQPTPVSILAVCPEQAAFQPLNDPVIKSFSSAPVEQIMMGMEGDQVTVDVTLPPNKQAVWRVVRQHISPTRASRRQRSWLRCARSMGRKR